MKTPVSFIVHSRRGVNTALYKGQYFFVDIRRDRIVLHELDDEPLATPMYVHPFSADEAGQREGLVTRPLERSQLARPVNALPGEFGRAPLGG